MLWSARIDEFRAAAASKVATWFESIAKGATMPTRDTAPIGAPCWIDLMTSDTERSRAFYCELFGWTAEPSAEEFGGYFNFAKDGVRVAGCMASRSDVPDLWSVYLTTDDARNAGQRLLATTRAHRQRGQSDAEDHAMLMVRLAG